MTLKRPLYDLRRRRDREAALLGVHLARGARVWWLAHEIWRQLAEPRGRWARLMAHHAAVVGTGRGAVLRVLERFLEEVDAEVADTAALARWRAVDRVIKRFERILAGKPVRLREPRLRPGATVLRGPWSAGARPPATGAPDATRQSSPRVPPRD